MGKNYLEDGSDVGPGLGVASWHEGGSVTSSLLSAGNSGSDVKDSLRVEVLASTDGILEEYNFRF